MPQMNAGPVVLEGFHPVKHALRFGAEVTEITAADPDEVVALTARDKKRRDAGPVPFVLVDAPGEVHPGRTVPDGELRAAVAELCR